MSRFNFKQLWPHAVSVLIIIIAAFLYCSPVLKGKEIVQSDILKSNAQSAESRQFREETGEEPMWTTRVFSGMTTFNIDTKYKTNIVSITNYITSAFPLGVNLIILISISFYIMLIAFGVNPWLALLASLAYGLSSNLLVSLMAGHNTKILTIGNMAPAIAGLALAYRGQMLKGSIIVAIFVGLMINGNHYQIIYYYLLISAIAGLTYLFFAFREKTLAAFVKTTAMLVLAAGIGFLPNFSKVYNVYVHSKDTIRGGKKFLTNAEKKDEGGLGKDYAMGWSYGPMESFSLVVPSVMGGASSEELPANGAIAELVGKRSRKEPLQGPTYIGEQAFTLGPIYFGAAFIFLFILSLFVVQDRIKVWLIAITVLSFFIAWGKHFDIFTGFLFEYFPLYNKFRTPSMALCIAGISMPLLGMLGLQQILGNQLQDDRFKKAFKSTLLVAGGMMTLLLLYGITSDWTGPGDVQLQKKEPWNNPSLFEALVADRKSMFMSDWMMSTFIMLVSAAIIWFYRKGSIKLAVLIPVLALLTVGDSWRVSKRYLNNDTFVTKRDYDAQFAATPADQRVLADEDPHFRIINISRNPWTDGMSCYLHENVGGHHAAKLQRYQDMIENQLSSQLQIINKAVVQGPQGLSMNPMISKQMTAYNMLNTKYFIAKNEAGAVIQNPTACGNAWFVSDIKKVSNGDEEMAAISEIDPLNTAIIHEEFSALTDNYQFGKTDDAIIALTEFKPNKLVYNSKNAQDGLAVFSEVYYPNGWNAYIDGTPAEIVRANYILRAIKVPAGDHQIEMRFEPSSYALGENVSLAGSILLLLFVGSLTYFLFKKSNAEDQETA